MSNRIYARLRARLLNCCAYRRDTGLVIGCRDHVTSRYHLATSHVISRNHMAAPQRHVLSYSRYLHSTTPLSIKGWQRKQFTGELKKGVKIDWLQKGERKGKLEFEMIPLEDESEPQRDDYEKTESSDAISSDDFPCDFMSSDHFSSDTITSDDITSDVEDDNEIAPVICEEEAAVPAVARGDVPTNVMGNLDALFSDIPSAPEPIVHEQKGLVESVSEVDYSVYYTPWQGTRLIVPEEPLSRWELGTPVPLDHISTFIRDLKCFDNQIMEIKPGLAFQHAVVVSVHNRRHLKDAARTFYNMCRDDYNMEMGVNERSNAGYSWVVYDVGHSLVHFFLPSERARLNIESFYLGQDVQYEDTISEERYTAELLEGRFPDEDFSKLGRPFELDHGP